MASSHRDRRRTACSVRRSLILKEAIPDSDLARALIVRWIGAAARKQLKTSGKEVGSVRESDNVQRLTWAQTFGRPVRENLGNGPFGAAILGLDVKP